MGNTAISLIPLNKLTISPKNVRKTPAKPEDDAELYASLKAIGLKQNLLVHQAGDGFHVHGGGRRLRQMQKLAEEGHIAADEEIRCLVESEEEAEETSIAENVIRTKMHPADEFVAFAELIDHGRSVEDVATRFGVTANLVLRRLKLGKVAPQVLDAYRAGELTQEAVMAFTLSNDHARQVEVLEAIEAGQVYTNQHHIRRYLKEEAVSASSRLGVFVGIEAYKAAGGEVLEDLFSDGDSVLLKDSGLLERLAQEKLEVIASEQSSGWKWTSAVLNFHRTDALEYGRVEPHKLDLDPDTQKELEALRERDAELKEFEGDWSEELLAEDRQVCDRLEELEEFENNNVVFSAEQMAVAGCIVHIDQSGVAVFEKGLVRAEDVVADAPQECSAAEATDPDTAPVVAMTPPRMTSPTVSRVVDPVAEVRKEQGVSDTLARQLRATRHQIMQASLSADFETAFDAILYSMCRKILKSGFNSVPIDLCVTPAGFSDNENVLKDTVAASVLGELKGNLSLEWLSLEEPEDFKAMCALSQAEKQALFCWCSAYGLNQQLSTDPHPNQVLEHLGRRMKIDVVRYWRPTAQNYWERIRKANLLQTGGKYLGESWSADNATAKKTDLASTMEKVFSDDPQHNAGLGADVAAVTSSWLPDGMAFADEEEEGADLCEHTTDDEEEDETAEEDGSPDLPAFLSAAE